jgi:hypothetical protein
MTGIRECAACHVVVSERQRCPCIVWRACTTDGGLAGPDCACGREPVMSPPAYPEADRYVGLLGGTLSVVLAKAERNERRGLYGTPGYRIIRADGSEHWVPSWEFEATHRPFTDAEKKLIGVR